MGSSNNVSETGSRSIAGQLVKTYTTMSGVDITAMFDDMTVHTLQGIAISITREKVPVYTLGHARPVSISRGKRGIAGTLQFVLFDRDALNVLVRDEDHYYYAHADEVNWLNDTFNPANRFADAWDASGGSLNSAGGIDRSNQPNSLFDPAAYITNPTTGNGGNSYRMDMGGTQQTVATSVKRQAEYMDQIYPFDVTLVAQNEYGNGAWSSVIGVEIINEGGGLSMDDLTNEQTSTYIAIHRVPWTPVKTDRSMGWYSISKPELDANGNIFTTTNKAGTTGRSIGNATNG